MPNSSPSGPHRYPYPLMLSRRPRPTAANRTAVIADVTAEIGSAADAAASSSSSPSFSLDFGACGSGLLGVSGRVRRASDVLGAERGPGPNATALAASKTKGSTWQAYLQKGLDELNNKYSVSNAQKIQKFAVVPGDFSEKGGELTATLKLKRGPTTEKYKALIDEMYV